MNGRTGLRYVEVSRPNYGKVVEVAGLAHYEKIVSVESLDDHQHRYRVWISVDLEYPQR